MATDPALDKLKKKIEDAQKTTKNFSSKKNNAQSGAGKFFNVGVELVSGVFVGVGLGLLIDWAFGISPWGLVSLFTLGSAAGMLNVYRALVAPEKLKRKKNSHG